jgi:hypothetical protein
MDLNEGARREAAFLWSAQGVMSLHGTSRRLVAAHGLAAVPARNIVKKQWSCDVGKMTAILTICHARW